MNGRVLFLIGVLLGYGCGDDEAQPRDAAVSDVAADADGGMDGDLDTGPSFDPFGTHFLLEGAWTVGGGVPDAGACNAASIQQVVLVFVSDGQSFEYPEFTFDCANGSFRTGTILSYGSYEAQWGARNGQMTTLSGPVFMIQAIPPTQVVSLRTHSF